MVRDDPKRVNRTGAIVIATIAAALIGAAATVLTPLLSRLMPPAPPVKAAGAEIDEPAAGAVVTVKVPARGKAWNIPAGQNVWLVVQAQANGRYRPMGRLKLPPDGTGEWARNVFFGGDSESAGKTYTLYVVLVDDTTQDRFNEYIARQKGNSKSPPLQVGVDYPSNVKTLTSVTVSRE